MYRRGGAADRTFFRFSLEFWRYWEIPADFDLDAGL